MKLGSLPSKSLLFRLSLRPPRRATADFVANSFSTTASGSSLSSSSSRRHHHDEDSRSVRVAVWWDFDKCNLPATANAFKLAPSITGAIRSSGIKGPITITAFGDALNLPRSNQEALSSTGINLTHVPQGGKNSADRALVTDLMCWVSQNPPPAHVFLISNDEAFASVLHRLRMSNYNVLLSSKSSSAPGVLCSAASIMWDWEGLVKGDSVVAGKYFNQPPDGPYNSWYGHYRVPLLDPFGATASTEEEFSSSSVKASSVPKEVVDKIRMVLSLFPKGLSVSELRAELNKSNVALDKEFYGHKSFARFLQSMPDVFQVNRASDGLFIVRAVNEKAIPKKVDSSPGLVTAVDEKIKEKVSANASTPKLMNDVELGGERKGRDISLGKKQEDDKNVKEKAPESSQESFLVGQRDGKANDKTVETNQGSLIAGSEDSMEDGFLQKLKRIWSGSPEMESERMTEIKSASGSGDKDEGVVSDGKAEDKDLKSSSQGTDSVSQISPSFAGESAEDVKTGTDEVGNSDKNASPGFFSQLVKSFKFWGGLSNDSSGTRKLVQVHDIFANESSWSEVESFIHSPRGFIIVSHSRTREMIAKNLQREGPSCLKQLDETSMLHLVTLLISDKKWIEENPASSPPFSVIKGSSPSQPHAPNGLCLVFSDCSKPQDGEKKSKNVAHAGVSVGYKSNALADCQKLIKKITEKSPEGYSLIRFRKDFLEEYGYHLAVEKLGYKNLQSLIEVMPGVRISSGYVLPSTSGNKSTKEDESDSSFEELGPVSEATSNHQTMTRKLPAYEPSLSEDEDSGSERDIPKKKKQVMSDNDKDSSLLQILDSYYKSSGEVKMEQQPVERKIVNNVRKPKPSKTYSFVKDSEVQ